MLKILQLVDSISTNLTILQLVPIEPVPKSFTIISTLLTQNLEAQNIKVLAKVGKVPYTSFVNDFLYKSSFIYDVEILHDLDQDKIRNLLPKIEKQILFILIYLILLLIIELFLINL